MKKSMYSLRLILSIFVASLALPIPVLPSNPQQPPTTSIAWNWNTIEKDPAYPVHGSKFPPKFMWGVGTSAYQVEGNCTNSSYHDWTKTEGHKVAAGIACDHENRYKDDIALMANELNINSYRFSVEWSKIEPKPGVFDKKVLEHYAQVCDELIKNNIRPVIGLHHYSDPKWFMERDGFAKQKNIHHFVTFSTTVFEKLQAACLEAIEKYHSTASAQTRQALMPYYLTFNSPSSYCANGYLMGLRPPGEKSNMQRMAETLGNMLNAHVAVYQALAKKPGREHAMIGITHNIYQLDPDSPYNPIARIKCYFGNKLVHDPVLDFFATGIFDISIPFKARVRHVNMSAQKSLDFFGINNYCHGIMSTNSGPNRAPTEPETDNPRYTIYAEGMYRAITEVSDRVAKKLNIPIVITENGIATTDDKKHDLFSKRYIYAICRALQDKHNVQGYIRWSFMDNYEWGNYDQKFGLYDVDRTSVDANGKPTLKRTLKPGAAYFVDVVKKHKAHNGNALAASDVKSAQANLATAAAPSAQAKLATAAAPDVKSAQENPATAHLQPTDPKKT